MKHSSGSQGKSVFIAYKPEDIEKFVYDKQNVNLVFQKYIPCTEDYRILVVGGKAVGIMKRSSGNGDWRHNFSLGGSVYFVKDPKMGEFAESVCRKVGFENAGIDIIKDRNGDYVILEINMTPGFEGFEKATGTNVAKFLVESLNKEIKK